MTEVRGEAQQRSDGRRSIVGSQEVTALAGLLRAPFLPGGLGGCCSNLLYPGISGLLRVSLSVCLSACLEKEHPGRVTSPSHGTYAIHSLQSRGSTHSNVTFWTVWTWTTKLTTVYTQKKPSL